MQTNYKDIRDFSHSAADSAKAWLEKANRQASKKARDVAKQVRKAYPQYAAQARDTAEKALQRGRSLAASAQQELYNATHRTQGKLRCMETGMIRVGLSYLFFKWLNSPDASARTKAQKVQSHIRRKPVESALIALGTGYLLGKLLR